MLLILCSFLLFFHLPSKFTSPLPHLLYPLLFSLHGAKEEFNNNIILLLPSLPTGITIAHLNTEYSTVEGNPVQVCAVILSGSVERAVSFSLIPGGGSASGNTHFWHTLLCRLRWLSLHHFLYTKCAKVESG